MADELEYGNETLEIHGREVIEFDGMLQTYATQRGRQVEYMVALVTAWLLDAEERYGVKALSGTYEECDEEEDKPSIVSEEIDPTLN